MESNRQKIESVVRSLGLFGLSMATQQLICAVELTHDDPELLLYITKGLYPAVAEKFEGASGETVERNIRSARDHVWAKGDLDRLREMAGFHLRSKPTTGEFIDIIRYYMESHHLFR